MRWVFPLCCQAIIKRQVPCNHPCIVIVGSYIVDIPLHSLIPIPMSMPILIPIPIPMHLYLHFTPLLPPRILMSLRHPIRVHYVFLFEHIRTHRVEYKHLANKMATVHRHRRNIYIAGPLTITFCRALSTKIENGTCDPTTDLPYTHTLPLTPLPPSSCLPPLQKLYRIISCQFVTAYSV